MDSSSSGRSQLQPYLDASPFVGFLGLRLEHADANAGELTLAMPMRAELARGGPTSQFHGGSVASLIDTAGDFALMQLVAAPVPTINLRVDYLRPCTGAWLRAKARVRRAGKTVAVVDIDVLDDQDRLCAVGRGCYGTTSL